MKSRRSSTQSVIFIPYPAMEFRMNCQSPVAPLRETACGEYSDSITGRKASSSGNP